MSESDFINAVRALCGIKGVNFKQLGDSLKFIPPSDVGTDLTIEEAAKIICRNYILSHYK